MANHLMVKIYKEKPMKEGKKEIFDDENKS